MEQSFGPPGLPRLSQADLNLGQPPSPLEPPPASLRRIAELESECLRLRGELDSAQSRHQEMEHLLRDLPSIFERKFQQRLQPLLERYRLLAEQHNQLRGIAENSPQRALPRAQSKPLGTPESRSTSARLARLRERIWGVPSDASASMTDAA